MKTSFARLKPGAFTLLELLVVIVLIVILAGMVMPHNHGSKAKAQRIKCINNLKQVGLALRQFAGDNNDKFPFATANLSLATSAGDFTVSGNGGSAANPPPAWIHFQALSNYLPTAKVLMCPADRNRLNTAALDFSGSKVGLANPTRQNNALSYFVNTGASETKPQTILTGDRSIGPTETEGCYSGYYTFGSTVAPNSKLVEITGSTPAWSNVATNALHNLQGNIVLGDASVQQVTSQKLRDYLNAAEVFTNSFIFPEPPRP